MSEILKKMTSTLNQYLSSIGIDEEEDAELVPTGIDYLDLLLGGGIAKGKLTLLAGDPGTFKSTLATMICSAFRKQDPNTFVLYLDSENAMSYKRLNQLGLDNVKLVTNLTVEKVFNSIQALMAFKEDNKAKDVPSIVVWDSIANTPTEADLTAKSINETIGLKARIISGKLPVIVNKTKEYNITMIFINQFREKVQMGVFQTANDLRHLQHDKTLPGGNSPKFNASQFLQLKISRIFDHTTSPYGFRTSIIKAKTVKNKFFPDGYEIELVVNPSTGIDNVYTNWDMLKANKKVVAGAWSYLKDYPDKKINGIKKLKEELEKDSKFKEAFDKAVQDTLKELKVTMQGFKDIPTNEESQTETQNIEEKQEET